MITYRLSGVKKTQKILVLVINILLVIMFQQ